MVKQLQKDNQTLKQIIRKNSTWIMKRVLFGLLKTIHEHKS